MKTIIDSIYPFYKCFDHNISGTEYESLPFREDLEFGPVIGNAYRAKGEPSLICVYREYMGKPYWDWYPISK